jgi:hypothetical protein
MTQVNGGVDRPIPIPVKVGFDTAAPPPVVEPLDEQPEQDAEAAPPAMPERHGCPQCEGPTAFEHNPTRDQRNHTWKMRTNVYCAHCSAGWSLLQRWTGGQWVNVGRATRITHPVTLKRLMAASGELQAKR